MRGIVSRNLGTRSAVVRAADKSAVHAAPAVVAEGKGEVLEVVEGAESAGVDAATEEGPKKRFSGFWSMRERGSKRAMDIKVENKENMPPEDSSLTEASSAAAAAAAAAAVAE